MKRNTLFFVLGVTFFGGFTSCSAIFSAMYGIKKIETVDEQTILKYAEKYKIPSDDSFELDAGYKTFLYSLDTAKHAREIQNHCQPLKAIYYNNKGEMESFQVNCYTGGFPNLNWDRNETMSTFPPKQQAPLDRLISLQKQLEFIKPLGKAKTYVAENVNFTLLVFWSKAMGRQSKRFIREIRRNAELYERQRLQILFVNVDNFLAAF